MNTTLRIALLGWALTMLGGCQYADLDKAPQDPVVDTAPAYQVFLRPRFELVDGKQTVIKQQIVIRDRLTGDKRVVDSVLPPLKQKPNDKNTTTTRIVTFGRFNPTSDISSGGRPRVTDAQNRRLLYLRGHDKNDGGQVWELTLDDPEAPIRRLSRASNICNLNNLTFDLSNISETSVLYGLPGTTGANKGTCLDSMDSFKGLVRLSFDPRQRPIDLGNSYKPLSLILRDDGSVIRRLVDIEPDGVDPPLKSNMKSCPFLFRGTDGQSECTLIKPFDNMNGCRKRAGCADLSMVTRMNCTSTDSSSENDLCDDSNRTVQGPTYRLANQFFRVGSLDDEKRPTDGVLTLYRDYGQTLPSILPFTDVYRFRTQFRSDVYTNMESGFAPTTIAKSPALGDTMAIAESTVSESPDLAFFSDGSDLMRITLKPAELASRRSFTLTKLFPRNGKTVASRCISHPRPDAPPANPTAGGGEIMDVRTLGDNVVFRWCGPLDPVACPDSPKDFVCELQLNTCPPKDFNHMAKQVLYAVPMAGGPAVQLDCVEGGTLDMKVLTSTAWTYNVTQYRTRHRGQLPDESLRRQARVLSADRDQDVISRPLLPSPPAEDYDGSSWLDDVELGNEDDGGSSSLVSQKLSTGGDVDFANKQSYVLALRNRRAKDTELFSLDLANPDVRTAVAIGTVPRRRDLRDHPDCTGVSPPSGKLLPGTTGGRVSGYGRQALIQLQIPRSAGFDYPQPEVETPKPIKTLSDFDIYAADLGTAGSLQRVSATKPPRSAGKRVFCPGLLVDPAKPMGERMPNPAGLAAADDLLIFR